MSPLPPEALVFDFDGTLATLTIDFAAMKRDLLALAREVLPGARPAGTVPALEWMQELLAPLAASEPAAARALERRMHQRIVDIELEAAGRGGLMSFARPLLTRLRREGIRCAVITRNCSPAVRTVCPDVAELVDVVLARDDVDRVKPDPDHLLQALERLGVAPQRSVMVGDHVLDVQTARRAGTKSAGVLTGVCTEREFREAGADLVAADGLQAAHLLLGWPCS